MAGAEQGDGRLRVGPYLRENKDSTAAPAPAGEASPHEAAPDAGAAPEAALRGDTQSLPTVPAQQRPEMTRADPPAADSTVVRAVAKRAAAALPALGPASTRYRARPVRIPLQAVRDEQRSEPQTGADTTARPGTHDTAPDVPVSMNVAAVPSVPGGGTVYGASPGRHADLDDRGEERVGDVSSRAAEPDNQDKGPERGQDQGPERGPDRTSAAPAGSVPPRPGSRAFAEAMTEQWIAPAEPGPPAAPERPAARPWHESGRAAPRPDPRPAPPSQDIPRSPAYITPAADLLAGAAAGRPGPVALEQDDWGGEPDQTPATEYAGRRRGTSALRTWLGIAAALVILAGAVGLPFLLHSSSPARPSGAAAGPNQPDNNADVIPPPVPSDASGIPTGGPTGQLGDPASAGPLPPGVSPSLTTTTATVAGPTQPVRTTTKAAPPPPLTTTAPQPPPPFPTTTIQAETGTLGSGAGLFTANCSGNPIVVRLGSVKLTLPDIPTSGSYQVQVFFVNPSFTQSGTVRANGGTAVSFTAAHKDGCPTSAPTVTVALHSGTDNTILISGNMFSSIYVDRIVISQA